MLAISRSVGQAFTITVPPSQFPTSVVVQIADVRSLHQVRIGIDAPPEVLISRPEMKTGPKVK